MWFLCADLKACVDRTADEEFAKVVGPGTRIIDFAKSLGYSPPPMVDADAQLCGEALFTHQLAHLAPVMQLLWDRLTQHANLFSRFPKFMQVRVVVLALLWMSSPPFARFTYKLYYFACG